MTQRSVTIVKSIGSVVALILAAVAQQNAFPALTPILSAVSGLLAGWLHLIPPSAKVQS